MPVCVSVMLWLYGKWLTISSALCIGAAVIMYCATWHNNDTLKLFCENKGEGTEFKAFSLGICKLSWALYGAVATACEYITQEPMLSSAAWFLFRETWLNFLSWFHILLFFSLQRSVSHMILRAPAIYSIFPNFIYFWLILRRTCWSTDTIFHSVRNYRNCDLVLSNSRIIIWM